MWGRLPQCEISIRPRSAPGLKAASSLRGACQLSPAADVRLERPCARQAQTADGCTAAPAFEPISHLVRQRVEDCGGGQFSDYRKASFVVSVESGWRLSCRLRSTCNTISVLPGAGDGRQSRR